MSSAKGLARKIEEEIKKLKSVLEVIAPDSDVDIPGLKNQIAKLQQQKKAIENSIPSGNKAYEFTGDGERQYLTGLKVGGDNVLILIDSSASMLDETIVNIVRRRNMRDEQKKQAPKWARTVDIAQWIIANLPTSSDFQVLSFNQDVSPVIGSDMNKWYEVIDKVSVAQAVEGVRKVVPENGTDLQRAFEVAVSMTPLPDNIFIITDGLPTLGKGASKSGSISGSQRYRLFNQATAFWRLAIVSRGAFVTPARDWP